LNLRISALLQRNDAARSHPSHWHALHTGHLLRLRRLRRLHQRFIRNRSLLLLRLLLRQLSLHSGACLVLLTYLIDASKKLDRRIAHVLLDKLVKRHA